MSSENGIERGPLPPNEINDGRVGMGVEENDSDPDIEAMASSCLVIALGGSALACLASVYVTHSQKINRAILDRVNQLISTGQ